MWEPTQATLDIGFGVLCGGKGTAPGCAHCVGAQRYQASTPSTEKCLTQRLGIDLANLWSLDVLRVG